MDKEKSAVAHERYVELERLVGEQVHCTHNTWSHKNSIDSMCQLLSIIMEKHTYSHSRVAARSIRMNSHFPVHRSLHHPQSAAVSLTVWYYPLFSYELESSTAEILHFLQSILADAVRCHNNIRHQSIRHWLPGRSLWGFAVHYTPMLASSHKVSTENR
jgi:hypothetical protein